METREELEELLSKESCDCDACIRTEEEEAVRDSTLLRESDKPLDCDRGMGVERVVFVSSVSCLRGLEALLVTRSILSFSSVMHLRIASAEDFRCIHCFSNFSMNRIIARSVGRGLPSFETRSLRSEGVSHQYEKSRQRTNAR
jgi:hypothetical protein